MHDSRVVRWLVALLTLVGAKGAPLKITDYKCDIPNRPPNAVNFTFSASDAPRVRDLLRANLGDAVTLTIGDQHVATPRVRAVPAGRNLQVTVEDDAAFAALRRALSEGR